MLRVCVCVCVLLMHPLVLFLRAFHLIMGRLWLGLFFYSVVLSNSGPSLLMFEGGSAVAAVE